MARKKEPATQAPLFAGAFEALMFVAAAGVMIATALIFSRYVNRVFDVPKATTLKIGGGLTFIAWLLNGTFGPGYHWRSASLFIGPVFALLAAVGMSTLVSIDPITSEVGVYERQFGFQGYLACAALFCVVSTTLVSRRGAYLALGSLVVVGGLIGTYSLHQRVGLDPLGFFSAPHNKVYSFLGNATFAGNALALIFPLSLLMAVVAVAETLRDDRESDGSGSKASTLKTSSGRGTGGSGLETILLGAAIVLSLQLATLLLQVAVPSMWASWSPEARSNVYGLFALASLVLMARWAILGSQGLPSFRPAAVLDLRRFDRLLAGGLMACAIGIIIGLVCSRTRGAWVGSATAVVVGLVLLPGLLRQRPELRRRVAATCWTILGVLVVGGGLWASLSEDLYARTIRSIPAAFDSSRTDFGKGQGTRPHLWAESIRVLTRHEETLSRLDEDRREYRERADPKLLGDVPLQSVPPEPWAKVGWRRNVQWLFGIGIETYRYAFMSHKSLRLESLDPMTNHDNPHNNYLYLLASLGIAGLAAYLWLLWRLLRSSWVRFRRDDDDLPQRALAFGVLMSFFSYAVYSLAGFDSVVCSVFLYFLLGATAVLYEPSLGTPRQTIPEAMAGRPGMAVVGRPLAVVGVLLLIVLSGRTIISAYTVDRADRAFVGDPTVRPTLEGRIEAIENAITINPHESYYRQSLGSMLSRMSVSHLRAAVEAQKQGNDRIAQAHMQKADDTIARANAVLASALNHAWAPENIFITAFQLEYQRQSFDEARRALLRALDHSPHLGAVRSNLALLEFKAGDDQAALSDCRWAIEAKSNDPLAHRVCGQVFLKQGRLDKAERHLRRAAKIQPSDPVTKAYMARLEQARASTTGASSGD